MKIVIIGAGAMGSLYGSFLCGTGNEVWLLDRWKEHIEAVNQTGLIVEKQDSSSLINDLKATCDPKEAGIADLAIIFVKSTMTEKAVKENQAVFGKNTIVLTLQNGLSNIEQIESTISRSQIIAGTTAHGATLLGTGRIKHAGQGKTIIGELNGRMSERILTVKNLFEKAGLEAEISDNVLSLIWDKLMVNVGINALTALTELKNGELLKYIETEGLLEKAVNEAWLVAESKGIKLNFSDPIQHTKEVCRATAFNYSSMLQDILNKRKTEIETINGAIVSEGKKAGIETPVNETLVNLIKVKEKLTLKEREE